ncbi:MAG: hypothetical protein JKY94_17620 [Rhodobacteraceae bacterium]|nr:hypothetical protein [Paracoccaceae bacterium]
MSIIADDFDGATVELQVQRVDDPGDRWAPISAEATRTGDDLPALLKMGPILVGEHIRAVLTGPGSPSNVRVTIDDHAP